MCLHSWLNSLNKCIPYISLPHPSALPYLHMVNFLITNSIVPHCKYCWILTTHNTLIPFLPLRQITTQDSGINLSIYCCCCFFFLFLAGICVLWMDDGKPICWFLHRSSLSVDTHPLRGWKKSVHHKNHAEIVKGTITIDIRYTKFYMSIYFIFMGGEVVLFKM